MMESEYSGDDLREMGAKWGDRIRAAEKREESWLKKAEAAEAIYLNGTADHASEYDFNILHSNLETMAPAVFNSAPLPDVRERFSAGNADPRSAAAKAAAQVFERVILFLTDDSALESEMEAMTLSALLAGRGIMRVRFDAEDTIGPDGAPAMKNERVKFECVPWIDYREGNARRWQEVPWIAFRVTLPPAEVERMTDPALKEALGAEGETDESAPKGDVAIWEIWCRESGKVYFLAERTSRLLRIADDPYGLKGFFPCPEPVQPIKVAGSRCPVVPFEVYRKLADELDAITRRIRGITDGIKVRGLFIGEAGDVDKLAAADDNTLIPVANLEQLAQTGGLDKAITWWPIDQSIKVLRELYLARDQTKAAIYEITGISDIVRGASNAAETATAQEIKSQWGSLRIRGMQKQIERSGRECFVLATELVASKFSAMTLQEISGVMIGPEMQEFIKQPLNHYRIDVESDSTIRGDMTRRKGEMAEFLNGTAQFFSTMAPVVQQVPQAGKPIVELYAAFARTHNLGKQADDALEQLVAVAGQGATQQPPDPQAEVAKAEMGLKQQEMQGDMQISMAELEIKRGELALKERELALKERELGMRAQEMQIRLAGAQVMGAFNG